MAGAAALLERTLAKESHGKVFPDSSPPLLMAWSSELALETARIAARIALDGETDPEKAARKSLVEIRGKNPMFWGLSC